MNRSLLTTITSVLFFLGLCFAIYFREPAERVGQDPGQGSALGIAGLLGIAVAMVIVRLAVNSK